MVLAIGLLVDDAIVVVENVERIMEEEGLPPERGDAQVDGPDHRRADRHRAGAVGGVRADGLLRRLDRRDLQAVLGHHRLGDGAVGGGGADADAGALRHACCKSHAHGQWRAARSAGSTAASTASTRGYGASVGCIVRRPLRIGVHLSARSSRRWSGCSSAPPPASCPTRIRASCSTLVQGPTGATAERTLDVVKQVEDHFLDSREATTSNSMFGVVGFSFAGQGQNMGLAFVRLKDWAERTGPTQSVQARRRPRLRRLQPDPRRAASSRSCRRR